MFKRWISAILWINHYPLNSSIGFPNSYSLDNELFDRMIGSLHDLITWPTFGKHENSSLFKHFVSASWKSILKLGDLRIFSRISQSSDCNNSQRLEAFVREKQLLRKYFMTVLKIWKLQGFVWKTMQAWLDGKSLFLIQMLPTFGGRCNRYGRKFSGYLILICSFSLC